MCERCLAFLRLRARLLPKCKLPLPGDIPLTTRLKERLPTIIYCFLDSSIFEILGDIIYRRYIERRFRVIFIIGLYSMVNTLKRAAHQFFFNSRRTAASISRALYTQFHDIEQPVKELKRDLMEMPRHATRGTGKTLLLFSTYIIYIFCSRTTPLRQLVQAERQ